MGGLLEGGGQRVCWAPSKIIGGRAPPGPRPPSSYAYAPDDYVFYHCSKREYLDKPAHFAVTFVLVGSISVIRVEYTNIVVYFAYKNHDR